MMLITDYWKLTEIDDNLKAFYQENMVVWYNFLTKFLNSIFGQISNIIVVIATLKKHDALPTRPFQLDVKLCIDCVVVSKYFVVG